MIPSVLSQQLRQGVEDFLRTTFPISTPFFSGILDRLLAEEGSIFKGPYLSLQLPFRYGSVGQDFFPDVPLKFKPYLHQEQAFQRLSGQKPRSSIVATGTGSGKTECFLYPILDHCYRYRGEPGIKAILIYPMNALATDQAGRIAETIWKNPNLKGNVTAGLFIGQRAKESRMVMTHDGVITDRESLRLTPPDILLTNYKMLDYLLIRPRDYPLWKHNKPETLRFLVVDELHTFDGAQGTDLACLLHRLKARLGTPKEFMCCIGTSATLGSEDEHSDLIKYAAKVFGESFEQDSVITESLLNTEEFLADASVEFSEVVPPEKAQSLNPQGYDNYPQYISALHEQWFGEGIPEGQWEKPNWRVELGKKLKSHLLLRNLLSVLDGKIKDFRETITDLERVTPGLDEAEQLYKKNLLNSFLALISEARVWRSQSEEEGAKPEDLGTDPPTAPFLNLRLQLWLRELRRMVAEINDPPRLRFADDLQEDHLKRHLPVVHCRECGSMGWAGTKLLQDASLNHDLQTFYVSFFRHDPKVVFLFPEQGEIKTLGLDGDISLLCSSCLLLSSNTDLKTCPYCGKEHPIPVFVPDTRRKRGERYVGTHDCPYCSATNSLTILGSQAASLTSVLIAQLYSSGFNEDKKLLTFSDSVQDAAHRAGFFAARTYRFNFRSALQKCVMAAEDKPALSDVPQVFTKYWSDRIDLPTYIATFLAPNMEWFSDYDELKRSGNVPDGSHILQDVNQRVSWEIFSEYGFSSRIGRTLEKTGSSVAYSDPEVLDQTTALLLEKIQNEIGGLRDLRAETLRRFLLGIIVHLKNQGGVLHYALDQYVKGWGNTYAINNVYHWMPHFGRYARSPVFLTNRGRNRFDQLLSTSASTPTWHQDWAEKCFTALDPLVRSETDTLYRETIKTLVSQQVLNEIQIKADRIWGLNPASLTVTTQVLQFRCRECGHNVSVAAAEEASWDGAPCLRFRCAGYYKPEERGQNYYGTLYATGEVKRIFAAEHTGLLPRDAREDLEARFKAREPDRKPWDPNLLSCTPTLEMGIDIGDLSAVILCSVPPSQSNYLQRVGRSGRTYGNALNTTVANGRPHDLYFFSEPHEMITGRVETPGVFLDASRVLERQLTAFCFDKWVESGILESAMPAALGPVLNNLGPADALKFPHNFLGFITNHQTELLDKFLLLFADALSSESVAHLKEFAQGDKDHEGALQWRILDGLQSRRKERDSLRKKVRSLHEKIRRKEQDPAKGLNYLNELSELKREKEGLEEVLKRIRDQDTFNFFTDEGLIPNYAFPEAGVVLRSIIYRKRGENAEGGGRYDTWTEQYQRAAVSAIEELAPTSFFYAGGRKVQVDQVDMDLSTIETWRLCDNCSHSELIGLKAEHKTCPRCGSTMWPDEGRKRQMLRMAQVFATTSDRKSRISDDTDDREPKFFNKQMLVDFNDSDITSAFKIDNDNVPFGFDFLKKATFREINFGEKGEQAESFSIAGVELPRSGFTICKKCGKVQKPGEKPLHAWTCTARDQESEANLTDCVYLYREFSSEAIRILLPITTFAGSDRKLHSFVAAIQLGLKRHFRGRIDHLQTTVYEDPIPESAYRRRFLLLYDTVPGGTGYLKELMRSPDTLMSVFELALETIRSCQCGNDPSKDGCYRCLFAYRGSYSMTETSRATAMTLLAQILESRGKVVPVENLNKIPLGALFDSELEARFIEALRRLRRDDFPATVTKDVVNNKPGYFLQIGSQAYYIEPQVYLGPNDGVSEPSSVDFLFRPARGGKGVKPVAVFTDGFFYHKDRIGHDVAQRMALVNSNAYHVWSLTWMDVENQFKNHDKYYVNYLDPANTPAGVNLGTFLKGYGLDGLLKTHRENSFDWFVRFLQEPDAAFWGKYAFSLGLTFLNVKKASDKTKPEDALSIMKELLPDSMLEVLPELHSPILQGLFRSPEDSKVPLLRVLAMASGESIKASKQDGMCLVCLISDTKDNRGTKGFERVWNGYLRLYNLFQFLPHTFFLTHEGIETGVFETVAHGIRESRSSSDRDDRAVSWADLKEETGSSLHPLLDSFAARRFPLPEAGFELANHEGVVVASAELAWIEYKIAILRQDELVHAEAFQEAGWVTFELAAILTDPTSFTIDSSV